MSRLFNPIKTLELAWRNDLPYFTNGNLYCLTSDAQLGIEEDYIVGNKLISRWQQIKPCPGMHFTVADTHFQAGLTFLLSWQYWIKYAPNTASLYYICCETQPLRKSDLASILVKFPQLKSQAALLLENYPILTPGFHYLSFEQGRINLILMLGNLDSCFQELVTCGEKNLENKLRQFTIDAWILKQTNFSEIKDIDNFFTLISLLSASNTTLTCIDVQKSTEASLTNVGFNPRENHFLSPDKQIFSTNFDGPLKDNRTKVTPWHMPFIKNKEKNKTIVIGAGLAGCTIAHFLGKKGCEVVLLDKQEELGSGASGNRQAILYPQLSAFQSPIAHFMLTAYLYAHCFYKARQLPNFVGELNGILQLAYNSKEQKILDGINANLLAHYPDLGQLISAKEAGLYANIDIEYDALFLPLSGWINCKEFCKLLVKNLPIHHVANYEINTLVYDKGRWLCNEFSAETVILANAYQANQFYQSSFLPLKPTCGQLTFVQTNSELSKLALPICGPGHILPQYNKEHTVGATYHPNTINFEDKLTENKRNLDKLDVLLPHLKQPRMAAGNWTGVRATTPDYFPMVGPLPNELAFKKLFSPLAKDQKRWLPRSGGYYQGLYVLAGFGSRGLTTIPLCADWLSALITKQPVALPSSFIRYLSPARFLLKEMVKPKPAV